MAATKTQFALKFFTALSILLHSGFLSNLRLPWKQSLPWIHCIGYIFFIIQEFWATCAWPENRDCPEIFQDKGAADPPPRTPMGLCNPKIVRKCVRFIKVRIGTFYVDQTSRLTFFYSYATLSLISRFSSSSLLHFRVTLWQRWANYDPRAACGPQGSHMCIDSTYLESTLK